MNWGKFQIKMGLVFNCSNMCSVNLYRLLDSSRDEYHSELICNYIFHFNSTDYVIHGSVTVCIHI